MTAATTTATGSGSFAANVEMNAAISAAANTTVVNAPVTNVPVIPTPTVPTECVGPGKGNAWGNCK